MAISPQPEFRPPPSPDEACARHAAAQYGVISRDQARELGLSSHAITRRVRKGAWIRVLPRVYRLAAAPVSWEQRLMAACLYAGPEAVVSHRAAGRLLGLDGCEDAPIEITAPHRLLAPDWVIVHELEVPRKDRALVRGIPVTRALRTIIDLGAVSGRDALEFALESALRRRMVAIPQLEEELAGTAARRRGSAKVRELLELRGRCAAPAESWLEVRFIQCCRKLRMPRPVRQLSVYDTKGKFVGRIDFAYPEEVGGAGVEVEGFDPHSGRKQFDHDRERFNELTALKWQLLRVTRTQLEKRPMTVARQLKALRDKAG